MVRGPKRRFTHPGFGGGLPPGPGQVECPEEGCNYVGLDKNRVRYHLGHVHKKGPCDPVANGKKGQKRMRAVLAAKKAGKKVPRRIKKPWPFHLARPR